MKFSPQRTRRLRSIYSFFILSNFVLVPESFRGLRKFFCELMPSCPIDKKIRPHHEVREGHEGFSLFYTFDFVLFAFFVVQCPFRFWLRLRRAMILVVNVIKVTMCRVKQDISTG